LNIALKKQTRFSKKIKDEIIIEVLLKNSRKSERIPIANFSRLNQDIKDKEIKEFKILYLKDFGKKFASPKKFVEVIEDMLIDYYSGIVQFLTKWEPSAPKMSTDGTESSSPSITSTTLEDKEIKNNQDAKNSKIEIDNNDQTEKDRNSL